MEFFGDEVDRIMEIDVLTGEIKAQPGACGDLPGIPLCSSAGKDQCVRLRDSRKSWQSGAFFKSEDKLLEAQRIAERTNFDVEMMRETGFCSGIENYSRHLAGTAGRGDAAYTDGLFPG